MIVRGRWYWTADKSRLVREGDLEAAFLAYPDGTEIPDPEAARVGLTPAVAAKAKLGRRPADKMSPAPLNKGESQDG